MVKAVAWAVVIGAILGLLIGGVLETPLGGVVLGCGIVAATVWSGIAEHRGWPHRAQFAGIFAIGGGAFSLTMALGKPGPWVGGAFAVFSALLAVLAWFTADSPGSDLGGPTD